MSGIFGKKQIMLAILVVALGVAVYLNYYFSAQNPLTQDANTSTSKSGNLGDAKFVGNPSTVTTKPNKNNTSDYFVQARLNRESARQEAVDIIRDLMNDAKATQKTQEQALEKAAAIAAAVEQESKIESLVKAKGFSDCIAYIEGDKCDIVVKSSDLKEAQALQITEIVTAQSNIVAQNVKIVPVK
ncbi:MAG TPA: sporulation protein [Ruminococcaceae bacterium]|jgi:stage III sporulation protein AH|nr:sporulation protein [Oscillospiraceae bacterium]HCA28297.1 sporulation protein [Oscillospiraceae bacterium]